MKKQQAYFNPITGRQVEYLVSVPLTSVKDLNDFQIKSKFDSKVDNKLEQYSPVPPLDLSALKDSDDDNDLDSPSFVKVEVKTPSSCFSMGTPIDDKRSKVERRDEQIKNKRKKKESAVEITERLKDESEEMLEKMMKEWNNPPYSKLKLKRLTDKIELEEKNKELRLLETVMTDQLCRFNISSTSHTKPTKFSKLNNSIRNTPCSTEAALSQLVKFETRMFTDVGKDAIRELTGFYFAADGSITIYEFKNLGKTSKSLPLIKRDIYKHLRGPRVGEEYTLTDILQEGKLEFQTASQTLPDHLSQQSSIKFIIVDVDINAKKKILLRDVDVFLHDKVWNDLHCPKNQIEERFLRMQHEMQAVIKAQLKDKGIKAYMKIGHQLRNHCNNTNGNELNIYELEKELINNGIKIPQTKYEDLVEILDPEGNSFMSYLVFMRCFMGEMSEHRKKLVRKAFSKIDHNRQGQVTISDIFKYFNAANHPWVISGTQAFDIFECFKEAFITFCKESSLSYRCFEEFYEGLNCVVDNDSDFENILKNTWNI